MSFKICWNYSLKMLFCTFLGVGALYVRRKPRVRVLAIQSGGGQERGMRSGTVPTPLVVGLGSACEISMKEMDVIIISHIMLFIVTYSIFLYYTWI